MELLKKLALTLLIILFLVSIFKDLTEGTAVKSDFPNQDEQNVKEQNASPEATKKDKEEQPVNKKSDSFEIIQRKVDPGETVLSIVEKINDSKSDVQIKQILDDFNQLNPGVDPHQLRTDTEYLFPLYKY